LLFKYVIESYSDIYKPVYMYRSRLEEIGPAAVGALVHPSVTRIEGVKDIL
jgi:hypothetical protein